MKVIIRQSQKDDLENILPLVRAYHEYEHLQSTDNHRRSAVLQLLSNPDVGTIWQIYCDESLAGYIVLCRGFSIEFNGFDAFIDEFFIESSFRGKGVGRQVLELVKQESKISGIKALHLEVARQNKSALKLYSQGGFISRDKYTLMTAKL